MEWLKKSITKSLTFSLPKQNHKESNKAMCSGGTSPQTTYDISYCLVQIFDSWKNGLCIILLALLKTTFKGISRI